MINLVVPFNVELKDRFLNGMNLSEESKYYYNRLFLKSKFTEEKIGKDLAFFNVAEVEAVLYSLQSSTPRACEKEAGIIKAYVNWAIDKGIRQDKTNPVVSLTDEDFKRFVPDKNINFTYDDVFNILIPPVYNASDAICIVLPFEGLSLSEIVNLRKTDVDFENRILTVYEDLNDSRTRRVVAVDVQTITLIKQSIDETEYQKKNGFLLYNPQPRIRSSLILTTSDFIVRLARPNLMVANEPVDTQVVTRRIKMLKEEFEEEELKFQNLSRSGQLWYAKQLIDERGVLGAEEYMMIGKKFNIETWFTQYKKAVNEGIVAKLYNRR